MLNLSSETLADLPEHLVGPDYDRARVSSGIVHIGVGNFHRTHLAVFVDRCLHLAGHESWGITGVGLVPGPSGADKAADYAAQDGLYTVTEYASDGDARSRVIGAMVRYLHGPSDPEAVLAAIADPATRILSLTITEGGYNIAEETGKFDLTHAEVQRDLDPSRRPVTVFRYVVEGLKRRRLTGVGGVTLMSCDNLRSNGAVTRKSFAGFARAFDPETADWMESVCTFPNSMVDRIAPKVGRAEADRANSLTGIADRLPAIAEDFIQWVMEDDFAAGRPAFEKVGVDLRPDVHAFEAIKGRMLNASHMMMSYPALLMGHRLVDRAVADPRINGLLSAFLDRIAIPLITPPSDVSLTAYRDMILRRFANPAVGDQVLRIAHHGISKLPIFLSATTRETLERGSNPTILAYHLACFRAYFRGEDDNGARFDVQEPKLGADDRGKVHAEDPLAFLRIAPFAPLKLHDSAPFTAVYLASVAAMDRSGAGGAYAEMVGA